MSNQKTIKELEKESNRIKKEIDQLKKQYDLNILQQRELKIESTLKYLRFSKNDIIVFEIDNRIYKAKFKEVVFHDNDLNFSLSKTFSNTDIRFIRFSLVNDNGKVGKRIKNIYSFEFRFFSLIDIIK